MFSELFPLGADEQQLANIEQSWADCAFGFSSGVRLKRDRNLALLTGLVYVHEELEVHRKNFQAGDSSSLLWALRICLKENLPAPYWCADRILERVEKVTKEPCSLHDLFGLSKRFPATGKKATNSRTREEQSFKLWWRVWELKAADKDLSKEEAIQSVRKKYLPFISQRTARTLFDRKEAEQAALRKALRINFGGLKF